MKITQYRANVKNLCSRCGLGLTWDYKVRNPRTGRMMPGHLRTRQVGGYEELVLGGHCPAVLARAFLPRPGSIPAAPPRDAVPSKPIDARAIDDVFREPGPLY